MNEMGLV